jgi:hypothetical protein
VVTLKLPPAVSVKLCTMSVPASVTVPPVAYICVIGAAMAPLAQASAKATAASATASRPVPTNE